MALKLVIGGMVDVPAGGGAGDAAIQFTGTNSLLTSRVILVDKAGSDSTGVVGTGTTTARPFLTAQAAYNAAVAVTGTDPIVLRFGVGTWAGIALTAFTWDSRVVVVGLGSAVSNVGGITGASGQGIGSGGSVSLTAQGVNLGTVAGGISGTAGDGPGGNGGSVIINGLSDVLANGSGGSGYGDPGDSGDASGGSVTMTNCTGNGSGGYGTGNTRGYGNGAGYGGTVTMTNCTGNGTGGSGSSSTGGTLSSGGSVTMTNCTGNGGSGSGGNYGGNITLVNSRAMTVFYGFGDVASGVFHDISIGGLDCDAVTRLDANGLPSSNILGY